ncbi:MAG: hypothetical protein A2V21_313190 [Deltaproteobacteria bacterium GWC2_55_46]|nr:MAG: hypothetical protein A2Z79_07375 [Deltaproteobacteria bacterium GWA2_55_82]OGQ64357.1 MAG: hypothetical protein A3I81_00060 [Deltaproteobacteria bacterium RIFCSPLOWO2_02_FULL_55_12]OIJ72584.1 MAG: hypothetical protein A2V21_313190 [Deltaproteobacteria bacterium GWC2_55_46]
MRKNLEGLKKTHVIVLVVLLFVGIAAVFGDKGVLELYRVKKERDGILAYNKGLEKENSGLEEKIRLLEKDKRYIGQIARKELGKLGRNEIVYKLEEPKAASTRQEGVN